MDSTKGYPGARWIRNIKGAVDVEKNQAKEISGLKKIDDGTMEITLNEKIEPGFALMTGHHLDPRQGERRERRASPATRLASGRSSSRSICRARASSPNAGINSTSSGKPHLDRVIVLVMGEASARDVAFRNKEVDLSVLGPAQYLAYKNDPDLQKGVFEVAEVFTRSMGMNPSAQAVRRQTRAPGDQPRHRHGSGRQATVQGEGYFGRRVGYR